MGRPPRTVHAAIAVIERRGRYLICQRHAHDSFGGCWEFPGGKREPGESWEQCLRRELREELGVSVRALRLAASMRHRYPDGTLMFKAFRCAIERGRPRPLDAQALRWVSAKQLARYQFPPANRWLIDWLRAQADGAPASAPIRPRGPDPSAGARRRRVLY